MKLFKRTILILILFLLNISSIYAVEKPNLTAQAHVQYDGWLTAVDENEDIGTVGQNKSLEAFSLKTSVGDIYYTSHVATIGWQDQKSNGQESGTTGQDLAIEAIRIELGESLKNEFDVYYRVHSAYLGWLDWAKNGEEAGTEGFGLPAQAIQVKLVSKDSSFSQSINTPLLTPEKIKPYNQVNYSVHCSDVGWQEICSNGQTAGTVGEGRQTEAIKINLPNMNGILAGSGISYEVHGAEYGWLDPIENDQIAGSEGVGLGLQAIKINLTGPASAVNNIYYRTHVSNLGWLGWTLNGQISGSTELNYPIEAIEIIILPKGEPAPDSTENPYYNKEILRSLGATVQASIENYGWIDPIMGNNPVGFEGQKSGIEAIRISVPNLGENSGIVYNLFIEETGWQGDHQNNEVAGTEGQNLQSEAIKIRLTGTIANLFDVYYQTESEDQGWLGWAANDDVAGTSNGNKKIEALRVALILKGDPAPDNQGIPAYKEIENKLTSDEIPNFNLICAIIQHEGGSSYEGALAVMSCVMNRCDSGRWGSNDPVSILTAPGQFSSYLSGAYLQFINNPSQAVQQAVLDCLNGKRSHPYQSFRAYPTSGSVNIGGNWFF